MKTVSFGSINTNSDRTIQDRKKYDDDKTGSGLVISLAGFERDYKTNVQ